MIAPASPAAKMVAPATARNRDPILAILKTLLPADGAVLEIASGTGEHAVFFARQLPHLTWIASDRDPDYRASITAWAADAPAGSLNGPLDIDVTTANWWQAPGAEYPRISAILCINMIHISPWETCLGLMRGAGALLGPGGLLYLYGPFKRNGAQTAPSNIRFEEWLKDLDPAFGVRDLEAVEDAARAEGLHLESLHIMPANNFSVAFRKA